MTFLIGFGAGVGACLVLLLLALRGQTAALRSQHDEIAALLDERPEEALWATIRERFSYLQAHLLGNGVTKLGAWCHHYNL